MIVNFMGAAGAIILITALFWPEVYEGGKTEGLLKAIALYSMACFLLLCRNRK